MARRNVTCLILAAIWAAACGGGSGSSGFDARAPLEAAALQLVRQEQRCVVVEETGLTLCPLASVPSMAAPVDLQEAGRGVLDCGLIEGEHCSFSLGFTLADPAVSAAQVRLAVRSGGDAALWYVGRETPIALGAGQYLASLELPRAAVAERGGFLDVALLVFPHAPPTFPQGTALLSETGARLAFVAQPIALAKLH